MPGAASLPNKKDVARALLLKGSVFVHLDPRLPGVIVPQWFMRQPQLVLQVGLDMPVPIPDLRVDEMGVYATLSFNRTACTCSVPWDAVFALVGDDGRGMVWPNSMPKEIAAEVEREARRRPTSIDRMHGEVDPDKSRRPAHRVPKAADKAPAALQAKRPHPSARLAGLELIAGEGERGLRSVRRGERRGLPPYLRVVK